MRLPTSPVQFLTPVMRMFVASVFFSAMSVCIKALGVRVPTANTVFIRAALGLPFLWWLLRRAQLSARPQNPKMLLLRSLLGASSMALSFYAYARLPLGDAFLLSQLQPVLVVVLAAVVLLERPPFYALLSVAVSMLGVLLIVQPSWQLGNPAGAMQLLSAALSAGAMVSLRRVSHDDPPVVIVFGFALVTAVLALPFIELRLPSFSDALLLVGVAVCATAGQLFMTGAYARESAGVVAAASYASVIIGLVLGYIFWHEIPTAWTYVGGSLILAGAGLVWFGRAQGR